MFPVNWESMIERNQIKSANQSIIGIKNMSLLNPKSMIERNQIRPDAVGTFSTFIYWDYHIFPIALYLDAIVQRVRIDLAGNSHIVGKIPQAVPLAATRHLVAM